MKFSLFVPSDPGVPETPPVILRVEAEEAR
jgi:hypothetical protein